MSCIWLVTSTCSSNMIILGTSFKKHPNIRHSQLIYPLRLGTCSRNGRLNIQTQVSFEFGTYAISGGVFHQRNWAYLPGPEPSVRSLPRFPAPRQLDRLCPMLHAFRRGKQRGHSICHLPQWSHSRQRSHGNYSVIRFTPGRSWQILSAIFFQALHIPVTRENVCHFWINFRFPMGNKWKKCTRRLLDHQDISYLLVI